MADSIDYMDIIKRAATATWQHKALWLFGFLLALGGGGGGNTSSSFRSATNSAQDQAQRFSNVDWQALLPIIIVVGIIAVIVSIVLFVLRLISEGALVGMAREISRGGSPGVGDGFRIGTRYWLRLLGIDILIGLPIFLLILILVAVGIALAVAMGGLAGLSGGASGSGSAAAAGLGGICGFFALIAVGLVILIPVVIVLGVTAQLARRHAVLLDEGVMQSLRDGWGMLRTRFKDVALWWLVMVVVGIVVGLAFGLAAAALILPGVGLTIINPVAGVALLLPGILVVVFLSGIVQAFTSVAWTDFFMQVQPAAA